MINYCINLDRRPDKWEYVQAEFARMGITDVIRFSAFDIKPGWKGCAKSHLAVMELCKDERMFCVFEDDVKFLVNGDDPIITLPDDWDMLSLGASPQEPLDRYSDSLLYLNKGAWCLHAYVITNKNGLIDFILSNRDKMGKIDKWFSENVYVNPLFKCFLVYPLVCTQVQFKSDTCTRSDVSTIEKNYNKFTNGVS